MSCHQFQYGCEGGYGKTSLIFAERYGLRTKSCSSYVDYYTSAYKSFTSSCPEACSGSGSNSNKLFCKKGTKKSVPITTEIKNEISNRGPVYLSIYVYSWLH